MKHIVIVEDEVFMREELSDILRKAGYRVDGISEFQDVTSRLLALSPDLILLDLNLPGINGFQLCRELKQKSSVPVLVLTSRDELHDELHALQLGADEYLTKPCRKERLLSRIANVLKRFEGRANLLEGDGYLLDRKTYTLYIHNSSVILPKNQGKLLEVFLTHKNEIVPKETLCHAVWGTAEFIDENALQVNLTRLKKTMSELNMNQQIVPVRGSGYKLVISLFTERG